LKYTLEVDIYADLIPVQRRALGLARTLGYLALALPDSEGARALDLAKVVFKNLEFELRQQVKAFWKEFSEYYAQQRDARTEPDAEIRQRAERGYQICLRLMSL